jgi:hypothetical protein
MFKIVQVALGNVRFASTGYSSYAGFSAGEEVKLIAEKTWSFVRGQSVERSRIVMF